MSGRAARIPKVAGAVFAAALFTLGLLGPVAADVPLGADKLLPWIFRGSLVTQAPTRSFGIHLPTPDVGIILSADLPAPASLHGRPIFTSDYSYVWVHEQRWSSADSKALGLGTLPRTLPDGPISSSLDLIQAWRSSATLAAVGKEARIVIDTVAGLGSEAATFELNGTCESVPAFVSHPLRLPLDPARPAKTATANVGLRTSCSLSDFLYSGRGQVALQDAALDLAYADGADPSAARHVRRLVAEETSRPNASLPFVIDHFRRTVTISAGDRQDRFQWASPTHVTLEAPSLYVLGKVWIPPSRGTVEWGRFNSSEGLPATNLDGLFVVGTDRNATRLLFDGRTTTSPPSATRAPAPSGSIRIAVALAVVALGLATLGRWLPRLLGAPLFSRLTQNTALNHERRRLLADLITQAPGIGIVDLIAESGLARGVVRYHLAALKNQGLVELYRYRNRTGCFIKGSVDPSTYSSILRIREEPYRKVLDLLGENPFRTQTDIARRLGVSQSFISKMLRELIALGVVEKVHDTNRLGYSRRTGEKSAGR